MFYFSNGHCFLDFKFYDECQNKHMYYNPQLLRKKEDIAKGRRKMSTKPLVTREQTGFI